ncbi:phage tail protein [Sphingomonas donggukensis]|uniref:Phage tail protein n=1 Tax=Sphingomonas donggukensis TaxID=2949093 RepID=A0ABY4TSR6_9SPHN|nr:phage tail protein [Sphingomonas donggukensis]URW75458.1 phage tail protein [Sphingomonas donggukensis]
MATVILTAVGTVVAGPIGGAIGAIAGQAIDNAIFKPPTREGPRLTELALQSSSYGAPIPKLFGTMRVAGTVIWSTDLIEHVTTSGGGKSRPATRTYSYAASFAVALSGRPIASIGRIWADGNLLRGAAGDWKMPVQFRVHAGDEDQDADPLITSAEGIALAPAHRGIAYVVFEDLALAEFGNRIPSLTFEVTADAGPVSCGGIVTALSDGAVDGAGATLPLGGYSAYGDSLRSVVATLAEVSGAWSDGDGGALTEGAGPVSEIVDAGTGGKGRARRAIAPADTAPRSVTVQYYDAARDYQTGLQVAARPGGGQRVLRVELPAVLDAGAAKTLAAATLTRIDVARERRVVTLDWRSIALAPGARVAITGEAGVWRVAGWSLEGMALTLELVRIARAPIATAATPGRVVSAPDLAVGETVLHAFEMPPVDDTLLTAPRLTIAAAGTGPGWRGAALQLSLDGGARWVAVGERRAPAVLGWVAESLAAAGATLVDRHNALTVTLATEAMTLGDADAAAVDGGANLAIVGDELIQFERAEPLGGAAWRLSGLWRGRRGTEWAAGAAGAGDRFVLIDAAALNDVALPLSAVGGTATVLASGAGGEVTASTAISGDSVRPPSPVHGRSDVLDGIARLRWIRRSRSGWRWSDGIDAPLAEEREAYRVEIGSAAIETTMAEIAPPAASEGIASVRQIGTYGSSRARFLTDIAS